MRARHRLTLAGLAALWACSAWAQTSGAPPVIDVDPNHLDSSQPYQSIASWVGDAHIVGLAESIHMTHEFPLARLGLVKALHEFLGFRALAFEGSPIDVWGAQDRWLGSGLAPDATPHAMGALFGLWNTPEMQRIFEYAASTRDSARPLYISAYDIQPGSGRDTRGAATFDLLQERLRRYAPPPAGFDAAAWTAQLVPLTNACQDFRAEHAAPAEQAIGMLDSWIASASPAIERRFPNLPHAAVLQLLPTSLRASLQLCQAMATAPQFDWMLYKHTRDREAAAFTVALEQIVGSKLMLWAHVSHLSYDTEGTNTSVAEELRRLGQKTFIVGTFAESGGAIVIFSDVNDLIGYSPIYAVSSALRGRLAGLCPRDCLFSTSDTRLPTTTPQRLWVESRPQTVSLADFDAVLWIRHIHAPDLPPGRLALLGVLVVLNPPVVYVMAGLAIAFAGTVFWLMRRRSRRRHRTGPAAA